LVHSDFISKLSKLYWNMMQKDAMKCRCGSGLESEWKFDARGIELCRACSKCWPEKKKAYRPDVLTDPNYWAEEDIDPE
jgi:hypothetical protein